VRRTSRSISLLTTFLLVADIGVSQAALPTASVGKNCSKLSASTKVGGVDLVCTYLANKMTWQVDTFSQYVAQWKDISKIEKSKPVPTVPLNILYSPTVNQVLAKKVLAALISAARFWQDRYLPKSPMPVLFLTEKDKDWYLNTLTSIGQNQQELDDKSAAFDQEVAHNGTRVNGAGLAGRPDNQYFQFFIGTGTTATDLYSLQVAAHEYTHAGQFGFENPSPADYAPCWLIEGSAVYYGGMLASSSISDLHFFRKDDVTSQQQLNFQGLTIEPPNRMGAIH